MQETAMQETAMPRRFPRKARHKSGRAHAPPTSNRKQTKEHTKARTS